MEHCVSFVVLHVSFLFDISDSTFVFVRSASIFRSSSMRCKLTCSGRGAGFFLVRIFGMLVQKVRVAG